MCGIVGYVGSERAVDVVLEGLARLEYRGYDSAGVAVAAGGRLDVRRAVGKIARLVERVGREPLRGRVAVGHTRWATHGRPSEPNAHPHADCGGSLVVVHNGILENYLALRERLALDGHTFRSETDTEVLAHLVERYVAGGADLAAAVRATLADVRGACAMVVLGARWPDQLLVARRGAGSVIVGLGAGETFVASDIPALLPCTRNVVVLEDGDVATVTRDGVRVCTVDGERVERPVTVVHWDRAMAEKGGYRHFMLKEIHEQPRAVAETLAGRVDLASGALVEVPFDDDTMRRLRRVVLLGCGTSYHAALAARCMIERLGGLPAETDLASEFRYRNALLGPDTLVVALSQSGETADTLGAVRAAREHGAVVVGITNVVGSALCRAADGVLTTHAGPEIAVASSKTFTATVVACYTLAVSLGARRGHLRPADVRKLLAEAAEAPALIERALGSDAAVAAVAREFADRPSFLFLGRGLQHPVALEGALKLKELTYIHAEGYAAGEMKHGPIALIDQRMPVVALTPRDGSYDRMLGNLEEARAREGVVIAIANEGDADVARRADRIVTVPAGPDLLWPLVGVVPLQLLAYHAAVARGLDVDQPRNLAKSVTVE